MSKEQEAIKDALKKVEYAANSYSLDLMHEANGYIKALGKYGVINARKAALMSGDVCRNYINNSEWFRKAGC